MANRNLRRIADAGKTEGAARSPADSWYKRDPNIALRGMAKLTNEQCGAYAKLIELTYARGAPPEDDEHLAGLLYMPKRTWARLRRELVAVGRIKIAGGLVIDDRSLETLAERRIERQQAVENGAIGGRISAANRESVAKEHGKNAESSANLRGKRPSPPRKNNGLREGRLNQVESESESEPTYSLESLRDDDATDLTPPAAGPGPIANVVPIAEGAAGAVDLGEMHFILAKAADRPGSRLRLGTDLFDSRAFIARAIEAGCDLRLDLLPVVTDRTQGKGGPIKTWRYFFTAWIEHRERRLAKRKGKGQAA